MLALAAGVYLYTSSGPAAQPAQQEAPQSNSISLTIEGLYTSKTISVASDETVLQMLQTINAEDPQVQLSTKDYPGMGTLVDGMHGMKNGTDKKYWQYQVNGVMPQIGADQLKLKNGDAVEWIFGSSQD